ncbi:hypothetical protein RDABS01_019798 [Bienertia sinuspersici]
MDRFRKPNLLFSIEFVLIWWFLLRFENTLVLVVGQQQQQNTVFAERLSLIQLRSSLGIRAKEWPIKPDPCSVWKGIQCNNNGSVVGINISGLGGLELGCPLMPPSSSFRVEYPVGLGQVRGSLPLSLGNLRRLNILILSHNEIGGVVPPTLGQLVNLSTLDLSHNSLTGSIPVSIASLRNLSFFDISSNSFSGSIPPGIGILRNLRTLNFSNNSLISDIPRQLGDLSGLVDLDLSFNSLVNTLPSDLKGLRSLRTMVIGNNRLSGSLPVNLFSALKKLEVVMLSHNNFSGAIPDSLWSISNLRLVNFAGNNFTGILPNITTTGNATNMVLNLSDNKYYGGLSLVLQRFSSIDLSGNYFEGSLPEYISSGASLSANCLQNATDQRTQEECSSFYSSKGLVFDNFGLPTTNVTPEAGQEPKGKSHKRTLYWLQNRGTRQRGNGVGPIPPTVAGPPSPGVSINFSSLGDAYTYQQLLEATSNFGDVNLIKNGHSGDLFRGLLEGGIPVVIKRVDLNTVKRESYLIELDFFSKVSHPRLVPLLGYCLDQENEKYIVYKYMPNADLSSSLYRKVDNDDDSLQSLDWITRLKIAIGAAEGLCYLHHECAPPFVHRDVQASSILLDDKFEVRLGSLSEVCIQEGESQPGVITRLLRLPQTSEQGPSDN